MREARQTLGLSAAALGNELRLGKNGGRSVQRMEAGSRPVSGPVQVAIESLLAAHEKIT